MWRWGGGVAQYAARNIPSDGHKTHSSLASNKQLSIDALTALWHAPAHNVLQRGLQLEKVSKSREPCGCLPEGQLKQRALWVPA